ncbi:GTPase IMAP family member 9-like [Engraulis encrasicolus]|uniref:GTPase IMAP family member 9-like n=1 Tax=Engraulis encrasicolus TaxID=184585 RepID=UPI002FD45164
MFPVLCDFLHLSELRIVLLGIKYGGKRSSGNTILGREEFGAAGRKAQSVKRQGEVAGRHITVVEAPGWNIVTTEYTPTMTKEEIELSVSLCPPGPHALLLVIGLNRSFKEELRRSVQQHLELLGKRVWSHTIVLFTRGDRLGDTPIEQHIESEGESLQWLVEKCGNRYHVFNNKRRDDHMQVTQLMEKIEEMVAANRGQCYENRKEQQRPLRKARSYGEVPPSMSGASGEDTERWSVSSTASSSPSSLYGSIRSTVSFQSSGYESLSSGGSVRSFGSEKMELAKRMGLSNILEVYDESEHIHEDTREKKPSRKDKYIDFDCP